MSREYQDFVSRCLQKNPSRRWSADALLEHPFLIGAEKYKEYWMEVYQGWKK